jgi:hypothetical protein
VGGRIIQTRNGQIRVVGSTRSVERVVLPPPIRVTAEEVWAARCELRREQQEGELSRLKVPEGAKAISLVSSGRPLFAIVDETDYVWISRHEWKAWTRRGYSKARAVATIEGRTYEMARLIMNVGHRLWTVRTRNGESLDYRRCNLDVFRPGTRHY